MSLTISLKSIFNSFVIFGSLITVNTLPLLAFPLNNPLISLNKETKEVSLRQLPSSNNLFKNGTYLYGQSAQPEEIGQEYIIFQVNQDRVVGAFYFPASEFACFYGSVNHQAMNISVVDPYDNVVYPHSIALQNSTPIASTSDNITPPVSLEGYKSINNPSNNDLRILNVCLKEYQ